MTNNRRNMIHGARKALFLSAVFLLGAVTAPAASLTNVVVMLGDSTTWCSFNTPGEKLTDHVQAYFTNRHLPARIVNSGVNGDTAQGGFARLQRAVFSHDPDVVTLSFGLNDTVKLTPVQFREWMEKLVQSIQTNSHAKILLITSSPFDNERHMMKDRFRERGGLDEYLDANMCSAVRALATKHNLPLCDVHDFLAARFKKDPMLIRTLILPDGVHLTGKGNEAVAQYVAPAIAVLLAGPNDDKKGSATR